MLKPLSAVGGGWRGKGLVQPTRLVLWSSVILRSSEEYQKKLSGFFSRLVSSVPVFRRPLQIGFRIFVHCILMHTSSHLVFRTPLKIGSRIFFTAGLRCSGLPKTPKYPIFDFRHSLVWRKTKRAGCMCIWHAELLAITATSHVFTVGKFATGETQKCFWSVLSIAS